MKTVIAFLLVSLSASLASAALLPCLQKMTKEQGEVVVQVYLSMVEQYNDIKDKGDENSPEMLPIKSCLVNSAFKTVRLLAVFKQCDPDIVFEQLLDCLVISLELKVQLREYFKRNDYVAAAHTTLEIRVFVDATCCIMKKIYNEDGLDLISMINVLVSGLLYTALGLTGPLLSLLGALLNVSIGSNGLLVTLVNTVVGLVNGALNIG